MSVRSDLLARIEAYCSGASMSDREFGYAAVQDGRFVERLRLGKATLKVMEKAEDFLDGKSADARVRRRKPPAPDKRAA